MFSVDVEDEEQSDFEGDCELILDRELVRLPTDSWPSLEFSELDLDSEIAKESELVREV